MSDSAASISMPGLTGREAVHKCFVVNGNVLAMYFNNYNHDKIGGYDPEELAKIMLALLTKNGFSAADLRIIHLEDAHQKGGENGKKAKSFPRWSLKVFNVSRKAIAKLYGLIEKFNEKYELCKNSVHYVERLTELLDAPDVVKPKSAPAASANTPAAAATPVSSNTSFAATVAPTVDPMDQAENLRKQIDILTDQFNQAKQQAVKKQTASIEATIRQSRKNGPDYIAKLLGELIGVHESLGNAESTDKLLDDIVGLRAKQRTGEQPAAEGDHWLEQPERGADAQ